MKREKKEVVTWIVSYGCSNNITRDKNTQIFGYSIAFANIKHTIFSLGNLSCSLFLSLVQ